MAGSSDVIQVAGSGVGHLGKGTIDLSAVCILYTKAQKVLDKVGSLLQGQVVPVEVNHLVAQSKRILHLVDAPEFHHHSVFG